MADGSRNNPADVHRTSRTSLQFHCTPPRHNVSHPIPKHTDKSQQRITHHNPRTPKKSPRGVQRGRGFTAPLRFSTASQSKKTRPSAKQESKNKTKNQPHNKQRKRKSQRKIKKKNKRKNKRKNKGEKA